MNTSNTLRSHLMQQFVIHARNQSRTPPIALSSWLRMNDNNDLEYDPNENEMNDIQNESCTTTATATTINTTAILSEAKSRITHSNRMVSNRISISSQQQQQQQHQIQRFLSTYSYSSNNNNNDDDNSNPNIIDTLSSVFLSSLVMDPHDETSNSILANLPQSLPPQSLQVSPLGPSAPQPQPQSPFNFPSSDHNVPPAIDASALGSDSTSRKSPSVSSDPEVGFVAVNDVIRSVLMHPMGLPLLFFFNNANAVNTVAYVQAALDGFNGTHTEDIDLRKNVFAATVLDWREGETDLTEKLMFNIQHCQIGASSLLTEREKQITGNEGQKAKVDYIFSEGKDTKKSIIALFEFGLENNNWWTKQHQILKYVKMMRTEEDTNYKFDQPILLSTITINSTSQIGGKSKKRAQTEELTDEAKRAAQIATFQSNLSKVTNNENNIRGRPFEARFGVFLCMPKGNDDFRITLLWRHTTQTISDASAQFGKILHAVQFCSYLRKYCNDNKNTIQYKYLGPNCCKIGDLLFRSYDNRLRQTNRRPDLYFEPIAINNDSGRSAAEHVSADITTNNFAGRIAEIVVDLRDEYSKLKFGESLPMNSVDAMDWLWTYQGKLLIISTPYHNGVHYAAHPLHFQPIINHLKQLHEHGFVHGDIRAYNMVLNYTASRSASRSESGEVVGGGHRNDSRDENMGWLIDFDFGGKHGDVEYPKGYKDELHDGIRPGKEGNKITIMDDWQSLIGLIFHTHSFVKIQEAELSPEQELSMLRTKEELFSYRDMEVDEVTDVSLLSNWNHPMILLQNYLVQISNVYVVKPRRNYRSDLSQCGLWTDGKASNQSHAATGSPKK